MGMTPAVAGLIVRTIGPPPPMVRSSGGRMTLLVSASELTSDANDNWWFPPVASLHEATSVRRLNWGTLGPAAPAANVVAPDHVVIVCVACRLPNPAWARGQSIQSVASAVAGSGSQSSVVLVMLVVPSAR